MMAGSQGKVMNKFTTNLCLLLTCILGCNSLLRCAGEHPQRPLASLPENAISVFTTELDSVKGRIPIPDEDKGPAAPLVTAPAVHQPSESAFSYLFNEEFGYLSIPGEHQPTLLFDDDGYVQTSDLGIFRPDVRDEWAASANTGLQQTSNSWNYWFATNDGWIVGKGVRIGISETPFNSLTATLTSVSTFLTVPQGEYGQWCFGMSYSGAVTHPYLVPRIQYIWQPSPRIRANIGVILQNTGDPVVDLFLGIWH